MHGRLLVSVGRTRANRSPAADRDGDEKRSQRDGASGVAALAIERGAACGHAPKHVHEC
jgi:hypothetical protein